MIIETRSIVHGHSSAHLVGTIATAIWCHCMGGSPSDKSLVVPNEWWATVRAVKFCPYCGKEVGA